MVGMFMQLIQGKVADEARLQELMDRWRRDLEPGATGYLGTTSGSCDDGTYLALVRFASAEDARRNSDRPEQAAWWREAEQCFDGPVTFMDCPQVTFWMQGGSDDAGFVQVMEGHASDPNRITQLLDMSGDRIHELRPEIIGSTFSTTPEGDYVEAVYFTSEAEARDHEKMDLPADMQATFEEIMQQMGEVTYLDLHHPRMITAGK
jgi:hypothetical protein